MLVLSTTIFILQFLQISSQSSFTDECKVWSETEIGKRILQFLLKNINDRADETIIMDELNLFEQQQYTQIQNLIDKGVVNQRQLISQKQEFKQELFSLKFVQKSLQTQMNFTSKAYEVSSQYSDLQNNNSLNLTKTTKSYMTIKYQTNSEERERRRLVEVHKISTLGFKLFSDLGELVEQQKLSQTQELSGQINVNYHKTQQRVSKDIQNLINDKCRQAQKALQLQLKKLDEEHPFTFIISAFLKVLQDENVNMITEIPAHLQRLSEYTEECIEEIDRELYTKNQELEEREVIFEEYFQDLNSQVEISRDTSENFSYQQEQLLATSEAISKTVLEFQAKLSALVMYDLIANFKQQYQDDLKLQRQDLEMIRKLKLLLYESKRDFTKMIKSIFD